MRQTFAVGIGGAAGQGVATPGDIFANQWFRPRVKKLEDDAAYDPKDWMAAMEKSLLWGEEIPIGKFFERNDVPTLRAAEPVLGAGPLVHADTRIPRDVTRAFVEELT